MKKHLKSAYKTALLTTLISLLFSSASTYAATADAAAGGTPAMVGTFELLKEDGRPLVCRYDFYNMDFPYNSDRELPCGMKNAKYIRLTSVPSAAEITFQQSANASGGCADTGGYKFKIVLKTRRGQGTSTDPLDINTMLRGAEVHYMVANGLEVVDVQRLQNIDPNYNYEGATTCILIREPR